MTEEKDDNFYERVQRLRKGDLVAQNRTNSEGHSSFYRNPEEIQNLLNRANMLKYRADQIRTPESLKHYSLAYLCHIRVHILYKGQNKEHFGALKQAHRAAIQQCEKHQAKQLITVLYYFMYIIYHDITMNTVSHSVKRENKDEFLNHNYHNILNLCGLFRHFREKEYPIIPLGKLEEQLKKMMPEYFDTNR
ncbi:hypothetical protein ECANGB1_697 [Enterospora canceri]|uniref:Uncharacterized protein n=1 Tax=Enterospora canceri TaxID=1081671 RepID=A0A1Y1S7N3_9MICR|nr:hypothetical protein ECANGB1_697 [Enterospora canceri]